MFRNSPPADIRRSVFHVRGIFWREERRSLPESARHGGCVVADDGCRKARPAEGMGADAGGRARAPGSKANAVALLQVLRSR